MGVKSQQIYQSDWFHHDISPQERVDEVYGGKWPHSRTLGFVVLSNAFLWAVILTVAAEFI